MIEEEVSKKVAEGGFRGQMASGTERSFSLCSLREWRQDGDACQQLIRLGVKNNETLTISWPVNHTKKEKVGRIAAC